MKKLLFISLLLIVVFACKKTKFSPEGPTDIRVRNLSDLTFNEVIVNTSGGIDTLGTINGKSASKYFRFKKAFPKAEISAKINGITYTTGTVNYTYMTCLGQGKFTYEVFIPSANKLEIGSVIPDAPLDSI